MNIRLSNQHNMISSCLRVAQSRDHALVWNGQEPVDFGTDLAALEAGFKIALGKSVLADSAKGGATDTKAQAETTLENNTYVLARALAVHFKKTDDLTRRAQVDLTHSQIVQLRENDLVSKASMIRDLGAAARTEEGAERRGVTAARVDALTASLDAFKFSMSLPRGQIVNRSTLLRELETDTAALLEQLSDLDDLVLQFEGSAAGHRFIAAWKQARVIIDRTAEHAAKAPAVPTTAGSAAK